MKYGHVLASILLLALSCKQPGMTPDVIDLSVDKEAAKSLKVRLQPQMFKYPLIAKISKIQGEVVIQAIFDKNGDPISVKDLSGPSILVDVAKEYVSGFRYYPLIINGEPRPFKTKTTCTFKLDLNSVPPVK